MPRYTAPIVLALLALLLSAPAALAAPAHHRCHHHRHACRHSTHRRSSAMSPNSASSRAQPVTGGAVADPEVEAPFDTDGSEDEGLPIRIEPDGTEVLSEEPTTPEQEAFRAPEASGPEVEELEEQMREEGLL
ncbi:MAG TPA: hypothetical protein VGG08_04545 [Solirubrobacteraceae bacterium]|jgi:hypothetical protein